MTKTTTTSGNFFTIRAWSSRRSCCPEGRRIPTIRMEITRSSKRWSSSVMKAKTPRRRRVCSTASEDYLDAERRAATAGALHIGIFELEARALQGFDVIHHAAVQIHERSGVNIHLETIEVEGFVHHSGGILEGHGIREARTASAHHANPQPRGHGILLSHDLAHLANRRRSQHYGRDLGRCGGCGFNVGYRGG